MPRLRTAELASSLAEGMMARLDKGGEGRERAQVISAWRLVAGAEVFSHARGFAVRGDELLVFVDLPVWANELSVLSERYRMAVNERIGKEAVGSIRFAVSKRVSEEVASETHEEAEAKQIDEKTTPVPATENERRQVRAMAAGIKPGELREAVVAAAIAHLEWRKGIEERIAAEKATQCATEGIPGPQ